MSKVSSGSLRLSGNAFQTDGLATENARQPNVFRRHRGTIRYVNCIGGPATSAGVRLMASKRRSAPPYWISRLGKDFIFFITNNISMSLVISLSEMLQYQYAKGGSKLCGRQIITILTENKIIRGAKS